MLAAVLVFERQCFLLALASECFYLTLVSECFLSECLLVSAFVFQEVLDSKCFRSFDSPVLSGLVEALVLLAPKTAPHFLAGFGVGASGFAGSFGSVSDLATQCFQP